MVQYIAVIDDSPTVRISVEYAIKKFGMPVLHAENGQDALEKIKSLVDGGDELALCICDINMPLMDGIAFINEYRKIDRFTPIIVLTTESEESKMQEGKKAGASGWIVKPFQPDELVSVIERFIKK